MVFRLAPTGAWTIVAGIGKAGSGGDEGQAALASLSRPNGLATDQFGNLFIADTGNNRIRKVTPNGLITTVAGNGSSSFAGDGTVATKASINGPLAVAVDSAGNLFIADTGNLRIRRVSTDGVIKTVAGNGQFAQASPSQDGGVAAQTPLAGVTGVAVDSSGNVFIGGDWVIRKVTPAGVIGSLNVAISYPTFNEFVHVLCGSYTVGVAIDSSGALFYTDACSRVARVDPSGRGRVLAGVNLDGFSGDGALAVEASLYRPQSVASDANGNVFIGDTKNGRVRLINAAGIISTIVGNGEFRFGGDGGDARAAYLNNPNGVATGPAGELYIADTLNNRIRTISSQGVITTVAGTGAFFLSGDNAPAATATMRSPFAVAKDLLGNLFIADAGNTRVRRVNALGTMDTVLGGANGVAVDANNNLFVTDAGHVYERTSSGMANIVAGSDQLGLLYAVGTDALGNIYVAAPGNGQVREISTDGTIKTVAGNGKSGSSGDGGLATNASFMYPIGVAVDGGGNVFIADILDNRVRMVNAVGIINTVAGTGKPGLSGDGGPANKAALNGPFGVALHLDGNLYIADSGNHRIRMVAGVGAPLLPVATRVVNAATNQPGAIAPGSLVSIYGANLASGISKASQLPLPLKLGNTQVLIGDAALPISYASPGQLNAQVPADLATGSVVLTVRRGSTTSPPVKVNLMTANPGIFTLAQGGTGQGIITRSDGITLAQAGTPATVGETIVIYCTGLGSVTPPVPAGAPAPVAPLSLVDRPVEVTIGEQPALVRFAGLTPGYSGLYQVNAVVPVLTQTGDAIPVVIRTGGQTSPPATIAVR